MFMHEPVKCDKALILALLALTLATSALGAVVMHIVG
jgi:hypothetical protein